ncbi:hypothetical protein WG66_012725 [Moniliophthora roreri]|nr:hypothetical protein WG66_012725 [Moniliophthora roreri]
MNELNQIISLLVQNPLPPRREGVSFLHQATFGSRFQKRFCTTRAWIWNTESDFWTSFVAMEVRTYNYVGFIVLSTAARGLATEREIRERRKKGRYDLESILGLTGLPGFQTFRSQGSGGRAQGIDMAKKSFGFLEKGIYRRVRSG